MRILLLIFVVPGLCLAVQEPTSPKAKITVGKDTTLLLKPVGKNGYIDYGEAVNQLQSKGVTPENNVVIRLRKIAGTADVAPRIQEEYFRRLGVPMQPQADRKSIFNSQYPDDLSRLMTEPWTEPPNPDGARWIQSNAELLDAIREACRLEGFYSPVVVGDGALFEAILPDVTMCRSFSRGLVADAMLSLGNNREGQALNSLLATHQLAAHVGNGWTTIEVLVANVIREMALRGEIAYLDHARPNRAKMRFWMKRRSKVRRHKTVAENVRTGERYIFLDLATRMAQGKSGTWLKDLNPQLTRLTAAAFRVRLKNSAIDWDAILRELNREIEALAASVESDDPTKRTADIKAFEARTARFKAKSDAFGPLMLTADTKTLQENLATLLLHSLGPAIATARRSKLRTSSLDDVVHVGWALSAWNVEKDSWPDELNNLVPDYIKSLPVDRFDGKPLRYQRNDDGSVMVYSIGEDLTDNDGNLYNGRGGTDIGLRLRKR